MPGSTTTSPWSAASLLSASNTSSSLGLAEKNITLRHRQHSSSRAVPIKTSMLHNQHAQQCWSLRGTQVSCVYKVDLACSLALLLKMQTSAHLDNCS